MAALTAERFFGSVNIPTDDVAVERKAGLAFFCPGRSNFEAAFFLKMETYRFTLEAPLCSAQGGASSALTTGARGHCV